MIEGIPQELPIDKFPLQNYELERTDLLWRIGAGNKRTRILVGLRDPGEANALLPVLNKLTQEPCDMFVMADSLGKKMVENAALGFTRSRSFDPLLRIVSIKADIMLTGFSGMPGTELALTANARQSGIPVVWIEDYPGGILPYYRLNKPHPTNPAVIPDYIFVVNEWAKEEELKYIPGFNPSKIIVTGQPAFDSIAVEDRQGTRARVREALKMGSGESLIVYMGIPTIASAEALEILVKGINDLGLRNFRLVNRRHPRDTTPNETYDQITDSVRPCIVDTTGFTTDKVGMAADLVITTYSTTGIEAVQRGVPSIHILIKDILAKSESGENVPIPPPVLDGSSLAVYKPEEMADVLNQALLQPDFLRQKMSKWKVDGHATDRVVDLILKIAREYKRS